VGEAVRWSEFEATQPELAARGKQLLYQFGLGLGFLATIRKDGAPRLHPFCPIITAGGLYGFIVRSPKQDDLRRDGRMAIHAFPPEEIDDEFMLGGRAVEVSDPAVVAAVRDAFTAPVQEPEREALFEFLVDRALLTTYGPRPSLPLSYAKWRA
jgi:hypothetical protein